MLNETGDFCIHLKIMGKGGITSGELGVTVTRLLLTIVYYINSWHDVRFKPTITVH